MKTLTRLVLLCGGLVVCPGAGHAYTLELVTQVTPAPARAILVTATIGDWKKDSATFWSTDELPVVEAFGHLGWELKVDSQPELGLYVRQTKTGPAVTALHQFLDASHLKALGPLVGRTLTAVGASSVPDVATYGRVVRGLVPMGTETVRYRDELGSIVAVDVPVQQVRRITSIRPAS